MAEAGGGGVDQDAGSLPSHTNGVGGGGSSTWEIEELEPDDGRPPRSVPVADDVYVAVGSGGSSMAALSWALRRLAKPRSFVYLVHVFPVVTSIPTPCEPTTAWSLSPSASSSLFLLLNNMSYY